MRLLVAVLATLALLLPSPAGAETHFPGEERFRAGAARSCSPEGPTCLTIEGRGFGHGKGMSQYGAQGAASRGLTWVQIMAFYYPGTSWATYAGAIRVKLSADTDKDTIVRPRSGLAVYDHGTRKVSTLPTGIGATRWRLHTGGDGGIYLSYYAGGWRFRSRLTSIGEFRAPGPIQLETPSGVRSYRGHLRYVAWQQPDGQRTVNVLPIDDYLKGVVPREMPALWEPHAVRAQSVAARTYALHERQARVGKPWEICDTTSCQVYGGFDDEHAASNGAIATTAGRYLTYQGAPAFTQFSASNGGYSVAGSRPYLVAKADPYDGYAGWIRTGVDATPLAYGRGIGTLRGITLTKTGKGPLGGHVTSVLLDGSLKDVSISGDQMRSILGLKSTLFVLR